MGITYPKPGSPSVSVTGAGTDPRNQVAAYGTAAEWTAANPVLAVGELGYETDTYVYKVGDGSTAWASLTTAGSGTYAAISSAKSTIAYNADGTVATVTETATGAVTTYTYNADGTPATESRVLSGVTTLRTFAYTSGNLTGVS